MRRVVLAVLAGICFQIPAVARICSLEMEFGEGTSLLEFESVSSVVLIETEEESNQQQDCSFSCQDSFSLFSLPGSMNQFQADFYGDEPSLNMESFERFFVNIETKLRFSKTELKSPMDLIQQNKVSIDLRL